MTAVSGCRRAGRDRRRRPRAEAAHRPRPGRPAGRDRHPGTLQPTWPTSPRSWPPSSTTAPPAAAPAASPTPASPASSGWLTSTPAPSRPSPPPSSPAWHPAPTWTKASRSCCSATAAPARPTCSSAWAWPPASKAAESATSPPPPWSTSSSKPPTTASLSRVVGRYGRLDLLLLDELGYVQVDPRGAELLFQIITEREERASIAIGTNLPFSEWGTVFPDPRLVAAIVDRVTFNAHILETGTQSYRLRTSKTTTRSKNPS